MSKKDVQRRRDEKRLLGIISPIHLPYKALSKFLTDVLVLSLYAHAMGEKLPKGWDIERIPNGLWTRGFCGNVSDGMEFIVEGGKN